MLDVYGTSCPSPRQRWTRVARSDARPGRRQPGFLPSALAATALAAMILHLLAELASRLTATTADVASALSVLIGMAAVLAILLPFTVLCARRACDRWK